MAFFYGIRIRGIVELHIKDRRLPVGSLQILQGSQRQKLPSAFSVRYNPADPELMIQDLHHVSDLLVVHAGKIIIDDHVVRPLKWPPGQVTESRRQRVIAREIDAVNNFHRFLCKPPDHGDG